TQLNRIIRRAGLTPWPKPFHNLRATRQTELAERYPIHVVCSWLGNSPTIAREHYLQVTEEHYTRAATETDAKAAQNAARSAAETACQARTPETADQAEMPCFQAYSTADNPGQEFTLAAAGLEPARGVSPKGFSYHYSFRYLPESSLWSGRCL